MDGVGLAMIKQAVIGQMPLRKYFGDVNHPGSLAVSCDASCFGVWKCGSPHAACPVYFSLLLEFDISAIWTLAIISQLLTSFRVHPGVHRARVAEIQASMRPFPGPFKPSFLATT